MTVLVGAHLARDVQGGCDDVVSLSRSESLRCVLWTPRWLAQTRDGRIAVASMVGTTVEFYDFYIYATAAVSVFPAPVLPQGQRHHRAAGLARDIRSGVRRAPAGVGAVRAFRRSDRAKGHARRLAADHGHRHLSGRPAAHLPPGGSAGAGAAGADAVQPGSRVGRRVERRGAAGHRDRRTRQAGASRDVATVGRTIRFPAGQRAVPDHRSAGSATTTPNPTSTVRFSPGVGESRSCSAWSWWRSGSMCGCG